MLRNQRFSSFWSRRLSLGAGAFPPPFKISLALLRCCSHWVQDRPFGGRTVFVAARRFVRVLRDVTSLLFLSACRRMLEIDLVGWLPELTERFGHSLLPSCLMMLLTCLDPPLLLDVLGTGLLLLFSAM